MAIPRRTKLDREQERQRAKSLKRAEEDLAQHFEKVLADNFERLEAISDEEWQRALDEEGEHGGA